MNRILLACIAMLLVYASCTQAPVEYVHRVDTLITRDTVYLEHPIDTNALKLKGRWQGWATVSDYSTLTPDQSGIAVHVDSTPYMALTDSSGHWVIDSLPTGTYDLTFTKEGYNAVSVYGVPFVGGGSAYFSLSPNISLTRTPTVAITELKLNSWVDSLYYISGRLSVPASGMSAVIYVGRGWDVSSDSSTHVHSYTANIDSKTGMLHPNSYIKTTGFKTDDLMYVAVYPVARSACYSPEYLYRAETSVGPRSDVIRISVR
jgi:hypothetical protein